MLAMESSTVDAVTCFVSVSAEDAALAGKETATEHEGRDILGPSALDDELVLTAYNPEDYEYTMFLQFVDPSVEKEYLLNAKFKVRQIIGPQ